jgi:collagenase-like PrtC family protease
MDSNKNLKKMELVSPAGNHEQLVAAINAGADAVYLGFQKFSARAYADNFEFKQLKKAVKIAHGNSVKVYLALNTLVKDSEIEEVVHFLNEYLGFCQDGIIIQDFGLFKIISDLYPDARIHASTQMNIHNLESVNLLKKIGFKRVILAREMTLQEITNITKKCDIEIETFVHGSQCYSYSGNCYFSSFTGSRSGNRGRCTQPCRMKYSLAAVEPGISRKRKSAEKYVIEDSYVLSKKDLFTLEIIPGLARAGITALKIEGRMKTPEYVGIVTKIYRQYLDLFYRDPGNYMVDKDDINRLKQVFSREISTGYYEDSFPATIVSLKKSGSIGNFLGRVTRFEEDHVHIKSSLNINKGDYLEIWTNRGNEQLKIGRIEITGIQNGKTVYKIRTGQKIKLNIGDRVFKFFDENLDREAKSLYVNGIETKKNLVEAEFKLKPEEHSDLKLGSTVLKKYLAGPGYKTYEHDSIRNNTDSLAQKNNKLNLTVEVYSLMDARLALDSGAENIVINNIGEVFYDQNGGLKDLIDLNKYCKKRNTDIIIKTPHIIYDPELNIIRKSLVNLMNGKISNFSVSNIGLLELIIDTSNDIKNVTGIYLNFMFNVFNHKTVLFFKDLIESAPNIDIKAIIPSAELTLDEISDLKNLSLPFQSGKNGDFEFSVYSYGYFPVMEARFKMDYFYNSVLKRNINKKHYLIDQKGYKFIVEQGYNGNLVFLNAKKICIFFDLPAFFNIGINNIYIDTRTFDGVQIQEILKFFKNAAEKLSKGQMIEFNKISKLASKSVLFSDYTKGHFFREVT